MVLPYRVFDPPTQDCTEYLNHKRHFPTKEMQQYTRDHRIYWFYHILHHLEVAGLLEQSLDEEVEVPFWRRYPNRMSSSRIQYIS